MDSRNQSFMTIYNRHELTPERVQLLMNISQRTTYSWLSGDRNVPEAEIERLAFILEHIGEASLVTGAVLSNVTDRIEGK